jgi:hypothetical protein
MIKENRKKKEKENQRERDKNPTFICHGWKSFKLYQMRLLNSSLNWHFNQ